MKNKKSISEKKKSTPKKEELVAEAQTIKVIQQTIINRELKWLYPETCIDTLSRKAFRQKARNTIISLERRLSKLTNSENFSKKEASQLKTQIKEAREKYLAVPETEI